MVLLVQCAYSDGVMRQREAGSDYRYIRSGGRVQDLGGESEGIGDGNSGVGVGDDENGDVG